VEYEGEHQPPDPSTHAVGLQILGRPQPEGVARARPSDGTQFAPGEDQDQHELADEPRGEEDQQRLRRWLIAPQAGP
jgi:hypothetical protein